MFSFPVRILYVSMRSRKDYTMCTAANTYEIGQNRLKLAEQVLLEM